MQALKVCLTRLLKGLRTLNRIGLLLVLFSLLTVFTQWLPLLLGLGILWGDTVARVIHRIRCGSCFRSQRWRLIFKPVGSRVLWALILSAVFFGLSFATQITVYADLTAVQLHYTLEPWIRDNVPLDGMLLVDPQSNLERALAQSTAYVPGQATLFHWQEATAETLTHSPAQLAVDGIAYVLISGTDQLRYAQRTDWQAFLARLTFVKKLAPPSNEAAQTLYLYRVQPPKVTAHDAFSQQINLVGYDLSDTSGHIKAGTTLSIRPYWRIIHPPHANYSMFIHLMPLTGDHLIAQYDGAPTTLNSTTATWQDADQLYIGALATLTIPADTAAGTYRIELGLYDFTNGQRLIGSDGADHFTIALTVDP